jgi:hypothetical protein
MAAWLSLSASCCHNCGAPPPLPDPVRALAPVVRDFIVIRDPRAIASLDVGKSFAGVGAVAPNCYTAQSPNDSLVTGPTTDSLHVHWTSSSQGGLKIDIANILGIGGTVANRATGDIALDSSFIRTATTFSPIIGGGCGAYYLDNLPTQSGVTALYGAKRFIVTLDDTTRKDIQASLKVSIKKTADSLGASYVDTNASHIVVSFATPRWIAADYGGFQVGDSTFDSTTTSSTLGDQTFSAIPFGYQMQVSRLASNRYTVSVKSATGNSTPFVQTVGNGQAFAYGIPENAIAGGGTYYIGRIYVDNSERFVLKVTVERRALRFCQWNHDAEASDLTAWNDARRLLLPSARNACKH